MTNPKEEFLRLFSKKNEWHPDATPLDVGNFIEAAHKSYLSSLIEECEGMKIDPPYPNASNGYSKEISDEDKIHNAAIDTIITKLKGEL